MWCPAVVGWSALIGYNSKQSYWSIWGETEGGAQAEYPHLDVQRRDKKKKKWATEVWHLLCSVNRSQELMCLCYLWAVRSNGESEQVHGHKHSCHHADQDEVAGITIEPHSLLHTKKILWDVPFPGYKLNKKNTDCPLRGVFLLLFIPLTYEMMKKVQTGRKQS